MGNYLENYKIRLEAYGSTIQEQEVSFARSEFEEYLTHAPNAYDVLINQTDIFNVTIQDSSELDRNDEIKTVLSRHDEKINLGDILTWKNKDWLVINEYIKTLDTCNKVQIMQCNNVLKFYDESNILHELPCIINNKSQSIDKNTLINSANNQFSCFVQYNDNSKKIKLSPNQSRFILNGTNLKVVSIDNISHIINEKGYLILGLESDLVQISDDLVNSVADNTDKSNQNIKTDKTLW